MTTPLFTVDAFASERFRGNPAAVCLLEKPADEAWMQAVANEMNLSETAFLHPEAEGYRLRWFTPAAEVALCGHATLASAHILWETARLAENQAACFHTKSGLLTATRRDREIQLNFPAKPVEACAAPPGLNEALGVDPVFVGRSAFDYLVQVSSAKVVREVKPDFGKLTALAVRGVILTSVSDERQFDFISRFFAPAVGVNEDPVTGSAHCTLGPFWSARLNKTDLNAFQASRRGGIIKLQVAGDRVQLSGQAVTVMRGHLD